MKQDGSDFEDVHREAIADLVREAWTDGERVAGHADEGAADGGRLRAMIRDKKSERTQHAAAPHGRVAPGWFDTLLDEFRSVHGNRNYVEATRIDFSRTAIL